MSKVLLLPLGSDIPARLAALLLEEITDGDFSRLAVVFPNDRPQLYLNRRLANALGRAFLPPAFFSMDRFMLKLSGGAELMESLDETALMLNVLPSADGPALAVLRKDPALAYYWAGTLRGAVEELDVELVSDGALREVRLASEETSRIARDLLAGLSDLRKRFHQGVEAAEKITRGMAYAGAARAARTAELSEYDALWIVLPPGVTKTEKIIFEELALRDNVTFLAEGHAPSKLSIPTPQRMEGAAREPEIRLYSGFDAHSEILGLKNALAVDPDPQRAVIVLSKPESLIPLLEHVLSTLDTPYNVSLGYPFVRTPVFALLSALFKLQRSAEEGQYYSRDYLALLFHPYMKNLKDGIESEARRMLAHALEEKLIQGRLAWVRLEELEKDAPFFDRIGSSMAEPLPGAVLSAALKSMHDAFIRPLEHAATLKEASAALAGGLRRLLIHSPAAAYPFSTEYFGAALDFLDGLARSELGAMTAPKGVSLCDLVETLARGERVPFKGVPLEGLQVLGLLETRTLAFDRVYILDVNEEVLPHGRVEDPLLPQEVRAYLGLPGPKEKEALQDHHFRRLLAASSASHVFFIQSEEAIPSRFIARHIWEKEKAAGAVGVCPSIALNVKLELADAASARVEKSPAVMAALEALSWSASSLDQYLRCPMQFYFNRVLGLKERERIDEDVDPAGVGTLLHGALEALYRSMLNRRLGPEDYERLKARVPQVLDAAFAEAGWEMRGERYLIHRLMESRLRRFLDQDAGRGAFQPLHLELDLDGVLDGRRIRGKLDRVDAVVDGAEGMWRILDYKSGTIRKFMGKRAAANLVKAPETRAEMIKVVESVQMPVYAWLAVERLGLSYAAMQVQICSLKESDKTEVLFHDGVDGESFMGDIALPCVQNLLREVLNPAIPFEVDTADARTCAYCAFGALCGQG